MHVNSTFLRDFFVVENDLFHGMKKKAFCEKRHGEAEKLLRAVSTALFYLLQDVEKTSSEEVSAGREQLCLKL